MSTAAPNDGRVALVVMPMASVDSPNLAAGLFQASLKRRGVECHTKYFNMMLWKMLGAESYDFLAKRAPMTALAAEWAFSQAFQGSRISNRESYEREVLELDPWGIPPRYREHVWKLQETAPLFLRLAFEACDWGQYDLVGFTSSFEQTMASLCLARMIRERHPHMKIAMGGANFESGMGRPFMEHYDFIDYISTGEADISFPELCQNLREGRSEVPPGFLYREEGEIRETPRERSMDESYLESLPTPDYDDYFRVQSANHGGRPVVRWILLEASRGCWWGQRSHCTFCGLNGATMSFRKKSWQRVAAEVDELIARHGVRAFQFTDNILGMDYFKNLLPYWAEHEPKAHKFFEIKSNIKRQQLELLKAAGVTTVQAGVENLADDTLRVMAKGVSGAQNMALLRWCHELGIQPRWNLLYGFPKEDLADYDRNLSIMQKITHLSPPDACAAIRLDRFSPNHARWQSQGFSWIEPMPAYRHVFPLPDEALRELATYFRYDHPHYERALELGRRLSDFALLWQEKSVRQENGELAVRPEGQGEFLLVDSRFNFEQSTKRLDPDEAALLVACDAPISRKEALQAAARGVKDKSASEMESALERLLEMGVIAEMGTRLVTLALLPRELLETAPTKKEEKRHLCQLTSNIY